MVIIMGYDSIFFFLFFLILIQVGKIHTNVENAQCVGDIHARIIYFMFNYNY